MNRRRFVVMSKVRNDCDHILSRNVTACDVTILFAFVYHADFKATNRH